MGQTISAVRDEAKKESAEAEKTANDALNSLQDLAKLQVKLFTEEVKNDKDGTKIAVKKFLTEDSVIKCGVTDDGKKIGDDIVKSYKAFADGDIAAGIGSVLGIALDGLFGSSSANSNEVQKYFVTVGKMGYPYRVDMYLYTYQFTSETLIKVTKNVLAISIVISSVDIGGLDDGTIGAMVQLCYGDADESTQQAIIDRLIAIRGKINDEGGHTEATNSQAVREFKTAVNAS